MSEAAILARTGEMTPGPQEWWRAFFTGDHVRFQIDLSEQAHDSDAEARLLQQIAGIGRGTRVLDVPCGQGRHAVRLARAGADVTGLDASRAMLQSAERNAADRRVKVSWVHADMRQITWEAEFDCVTCLGGSFGYFGRREDGAFLEAVRRALKPAGRLLLDVPSLECISANHQPVDRSVVGGRKVVQHRHLDAERGFARIRVTIETAAGPMSRMYYQKLYTTREVRTMLTAAGFAAIEFLDCADLTEFGSNQGHLLALAW